MRCCTTHALYRSKLWQQDYCQHPQNGLPQITGTCPGWWKQSEGHILPPHIFKVSLKIDLCLKSVVIPWYNQMAGDRPWMWQQDSVQAHKSKEIQAWLQKECYDFVPFSHWPPSSPDLNPLDYFIWSYVENITNITSHNTKASLITAICQVFAKYLPSSRRRLWKKHGPSSGSVSRRWLRLKAATLNRCQLYYIIKLSELIFSIKVLYSCSVVFFRTTILSFHPVYMYVHKSIKW